MTFRFTCPAVMIAALLAGSTSPAPAVASDGVLDADQAAALRVSWRVPLETDGTSSPAVADGRLFVGTAGGLVGVDPVTGAIIINYRSAPVVTTPAVIGGFDPQPDPPGKVVFGSSDGVLHVVSSAGDTLWRADLGAVPASPLVLAAIGDPTIRVIVGAGRTLFAFDGDGNRLWQAVLEGGDISRAPVAIPGQSPRLIVPVGNRLYALDAATGGVIWSVAPSRSTLGAPAIGNPNIVGDPNQIGDPGILVGDRAGTLFKLDSRSGGVVATLAAADAIAGAPAIGDPNSAPGAVVGDAGGNVYAVDQTDARLAPAWRASLGGPVDGALVLANGVVYAGTDPAIGDPHIAALDAATGLPLFDAPLPAGTAAAPLVTAGMVVIATRGGGLVAYEGPDT